MERVKKKALLSWIAVAGFALAATAAQATTFYNMTGLNSSGNSDPTKNTANILGAHFTSGVDGTVVGTGVLNPFVRIQQTGNGNCPSSDICLESGYNTDGQEQFETKDKGGTNWDHSLRVGDLQQVCNVSGQVGCFYQFVLDINEANNSTDKFLSLDKFQVYLANTNTLTGFTESAPDCNYPTNANPPAVCNNTGQGFGANATKVYDIDGLGAPTNANDSSLGLNYDLNSGSGKGIDLYAYVPVSLFGNDPNAYVYLYTAFGATGTIKNGQLDNRSPLATPPNGTPTGPAGLLPDGNYAQSAGFEEWASRISTRRPPLLPEPMSSSLLLIALAALAFTQRKRYAPAR